MARIPKGIVVTTSEYTKSWLKDCLDSVGDSYPVLVVSNGGYKPDINTSVSLVINDWNGFELGGILHGKDMFEEFIHLMDTTIIKDKKLFDKAFDIPGHVFFTEGAFHYMGKFVSDDLPNIPKINNKGDAIGLETRWLHSRPYTFFKPDLPVHTSVFEEKHGRRNMVLSNEYLTKFKATWC